MIYNIIGLAFDLVGVLLLFRFGILPNNLWNHILMDSGMSENDEKKHKVWSKIAVAIIFIGFSLQLAGSIIQNQQVNNDLVLEKEESFENLNLGEKQNLTTGIIGNLKLKLQDGQLFYQIELNGLGESYEKVSSFGINLEDNAGFKISEINEEFKSDNSNLSRLISGDSLSVTIKSSIPYSKKNYKQIDKWKLTIR